VSDATNQFRQLRDRTDRRAGRLGEMHCAHLACRPGCHDCCTDITVSPVEYAAILGDLCASGVTLDDLPPVEPGAACAFLNDGLCGLYRVRPLICRTHGLPIAFGNDDASPPETSVSFCPKNFTAAGPADLDFGPDNTLDLDALNGELAEINVRFRREQAGPDVLPPDVNERARLGPRRIPLRQLRLDLPPR
jgi:hypothetical protein